MSDPIASGLIDISIPFSARVPAWPGDVPFSCGWTARREDGSSVNLAYLHTSTHVGTHADAPLHVESSWAASESLPLAPFVGEALVVSLGAGAGMVVTQAVLEDAIAAGHAAGGHPMRVLLHTGYSVASGAFPEQWPALDEAAAAWLVARGTRLFGTDAPSVDAHDSKSLPVHHTLFANGAYVLENLGLSHVVPGVYELLAQPLAVEGADAAPVRALLRA